MIFAEHNFHHNFYHANGSNDDAMQKDMIVNEITKIIADRPMDFIDAALGSGISTSREINNSKLIDIFLNNLGNKKFQLNLSALILHTNKIPIDSILSPNPIRDSNLNVVTKNFNISEFFTNNSVGIQNKESSSDSKINMISAIANAIASIENLGSNAEEKKKIKSEIKQQMLMSITEEKSKGLSSGSIAMIVISSITIISAIFIIYNSKNKNK